MKRQNKLMLGHARKRKPKATADAYAKKLRRKFGADVIYTGQVGSSRLALDHVCGACGCSFLASPANMLDARRKWAYCLKCTKAATPPVTGNVESKFHAKIRKKYSARIRCTKFVTMAQASDFACECGNTWSIPPREVLKKAWPKCGCHECDTVDRIRSACLQDVQSWMAIRAPSIRVTTGKGPDYKAACKTCSHTWEASASVLLAACGNRACPRCATAMSLGDAYSESTHKQVLDVVATLGHVHVSTVKSLLGKQHSTVKPIKYTLGSKTRYWWPHFSVGKHVVRCVTAPDLEQRWEEIKAAAKAAAKSKLVPDLVFLGKGKLVTLQGWNTWSSSDAKAYVRSHGATKIRVFSMDPGVTNFAWTVVEAYRGRPLDSKVIATGMLVNTMKELTGNIHEGGAAFCYELQTLIEEYAVDRMIMERFMSRGMKGLTIELVNVMIGLALKLWKGPPGTLLLITAAQWKNEWNRRADLKKFYGKVDCEVHQADSTGIGLYGTAQWFDEVPFEEIVKLEPKLVKQLRTANLE